MSSKKATASCFCGAVVQEFQLDRVEDTFVCSCIDCRKKTASMFASNFTMQDKDWKYIQGEKKLNKRGQSKSIEAGNVMTDSFCSLCGTLMNRQSSGYPGRSFLRIGQVDDVKLHDTVLKPRVEQFTRSRVAWFPGVEGAVKTEAQYTEFRTLD